MSGSNGDREIVPGEVRVTTILNLESLSQKFALFYSVDEDTDEVYKLQMPIDNYEALGKYDVITIAIEAGDALDRMASGA